MHNYFVTNLTQLLQQHPFLGTCVISREELFGVWRTKLNLSEKNTAVLDYVLNKLTADDEEGGDFDQIAKIKAKVKNFTSQLKLRWDKHYGIINKFVEGESNWLALYEEFPFVEHTRSARNTVGRPCKSFSESSVWSKRRKTSSLVDNYSVDELTFAASTSLHMGGRRKAATVVRDMSFSSNIPETHTRLVQNELSIIKYTPEEALALFVDGRLTKNSYTLMQQGARRHNADLYPTYKNMVKAKEACYPDSMNCKITETSAEVSLQGLVDHTVKRLLTAIETSITPPNLLLTDTELTLIIKWGCDGSSSHSAYKQRFSNAEETDSSLFVVCLVPLQLQFKRDGNDDVVWKNLRPSSTRLCRPIKLLFKQESEKIIKEEVAEIEKQIAAITTFKGAFFGKMITVGFEFVFSMLDGKTLAAVTDTSAQSCPICGATPKMMNQLDTLNMRISDVTRYKYGLSTLHAHIRVMEYILHVSYRLDIRQWRVTKDRSTEVAARKSVIQNELKTALGLLIDIPKVNYGTTNDGNTARRFFAHFVDIARITGVDENIIRRFSVILTVLSSGCPIETEAFRQYTYETAKLCITLYPWYYMPSSVHRILLHGADIVNAATLPIGMLSEEALECRNKDLRRFRQNNTRKMSRTANITDLWHSLMYSSDPLITTISRRKNKNSLFHKFPSPLDEEIKNLLLESDATEEEADDEDE